MTKHVLILVSVVSLAVPASRAPLDAFALWQQAAFRGANVMQAQCTAGNLHVLRSWSANQPLGNWNALAQKVTAAIRASDERTPILVNSIGWAYPQQFEVLQPTGDPRTVYTVHFYDPHYYSHQKPADHIAYPGFRVPGKPAVAWDKAVLETQFAPVQ